MSPFDNLRSHSRRSDQHRNFCLLLLQQPDIRHHPRERDQHRQPGRLTSVTIPESVTSIGNQAFYNCSSLTSVTIPESVTSVGSSAFSRCISLTSVIIPGSVTSIGDYAFYLCSSLTSVNIPNSVTNIGSEAFSRCNNLTSITIPESVTSIGSDAFDGCYFVRTAFVNNSTLSSDDNWGATLCNEETTDGLLISFRRVIWCRTWATIVVIPEGIEYISYNAFDGCSNLSTVTIPNSVKYILNGAFNSCSSLTSVIIPESVISIDNVFMYCSSLKDVYCLAENVPRTNRNAFAYGIPMDSATLYVPESAIEEYKTTSPWSNFGTIVPLTQDMIDGIDCPRASEANGNDDIIEEAYYDLQGHRLTAPQRGINIIRMSDGTTKKVLIK